MVGLQAQIQLMKKRTLLFFVLFPFLSIAQNTWVQKLSYNYQTAGYPDVFTGVKKIEVGADGSLFVLANVSDHHTQQIFKFSPNSNHYEFDIPCGYNGMQVAQWVDQFRATSDSGIIVCHNNLDELFTGIIYSSIVKYAKDGTVQWGHGWPWCNCPSTHTANDVLEKSNGGYYALVEDSLYEYDSAGNAIDSTGLISGIRFLEMTNHDLLVLTKNNLLIREDTLGNVIWSQNCTGSFAYDTANVFIQTSDSSVQKVDALTGSQIWTRSYNLSPISEIDPTHDGGFIASIGTKLSGPYAITGTPWPGGIFRADSLGDTLWTRHYALPTSGLSTVKLLPNGNICTGGGYLSGYAIGIAPNEPSAFVCMMNADGSYPLAQTGYVGPKDANNDHLSNFVDDALEVMLSLGQTGPARDTTIYGYPSPCERNDIAIDWSTNSISGANNKYSDFDGNGIIDTNDFQLVCNWWGIVDSFPSVYRYQYPNSTLATEDFCLVPVRDTIAPGDTALYYMIMGNSTNPVDSIYGFAFTYNIDPVGNNPADSVFPFLSGFGSPGNDLFLNHRHVATNYFTQEYRSRTLLCRTDFQNALSVNDTIGIIRFRTFTYLQTVIPVIRSFKAILVDGTQIPFNLCVDTVIVDSTLLSINEKQSVRISVFPNPASDFIDVTIPGTDLLEIQIINSLGEIIEIDQTPDPRINVKNYPEGIYHLKIVSAQGIATTSFIVRH